MRLFVAILVLSFVVPAVGQDRRPLEHEDYDRWNTISGTTLAQNGNWVMYTIRDGKDNSTLKILGLESKREYSIKNASGPRLSYDSRHVAYRVMPDKELVKKLKKEEKPESEWPKESFEILNLENGQTVSLANVQSYLFPTENGDWLAIKLKEPDDKQSVEESKTESLEIFEVTEGGLQRPSKKKEKKKTEEEKESKEATKGSPEAEQNKDKPGSKSEKEKKKKDGTMLVVKNLKSGAEYRFPFATSYVFDDQGKGLAFATSSKDNAEDDGVWYFDLEQLERTQVVSGLGNYKNLVFDQRGTQLAFLTDRDDYASENSSWSLYQWRKGQTKAKIIVTESTESVPEDWSVRQLPPPFLQRAESSCLLHLPEAYRCRKS